ncbi:MAG: hypothetical protein Q7S27_05055 [Nanoarchaeota archaeon]|nr:hypothetical protein [Nanoarchaeota archaeon]
MEPWYTDIPTDLVDVIEEGKIVRVKESYAKSEGLAIIRRPIIKRPNKKKDDENQEERIYFEDLRKPLQWKKNQVIAELIENFQWQVTRKRKELGLTRRQVALSIGESENNLKLVENGLLPKNDFVIVNKLQKFFNINLRKDKQDFTQSPRSLIETKPSEEDKADNKKPESKKPFSGEDIEIID